MKNLFVKSVLLIVITITMNGCATLLGGKTGTLPKSWWEKDIGEVENYYKEQATGIEQAINIFIAQNDSAINMDRSTAIENARLDAAAVQLSRYLSQKVTNVRQISIHIIVLNKAVEKGKLTNRKAYDIKRKIDERLSSYSASVSSTQFSSFKEIGQHVEKGGDKYIGWVCYSMSDQILEQTRQLQNQAFQTLMDETKEYKEIMQEIQQVIANSMKKNILEEAKL